MSKKVSVVIPTYNREDTLPRAIDSVINQSYQNWELFVVDDGSTDHTRELIQEKYGDDPRVNFIERPESRPKGANACRNIGMEKANGKYVAMLDSDDEWKRKHLKDCLRLTKKEEFEGCYSGAIIKRGLYSFKRKSRELKKGESYIDFLLSGGFSPTPSLFMKRDFAMNIKFDESLQRHQDWDFFIRFGEKYSWSFNDSSNVVVHGGEWRPYTEDEFEALINFYEMYKHEIKNNLNKKDYLYSRLENAIYANNKYAEEFYKSEILNEGFKKRFIFKYPGLYRFYKINILRSLKNAIKKFLNI